MTFGIQFSPWQPASEILAAAREAAPVFDPILMTDGAQSRDCWTLLAAIAVEARVGVGSCVSYPYGHNPLEMAMRMATIGEILGPDHSVTLGFGTGGNAVRRLYEQGHTLERTRDFIEVLRRLLKGDAVLVEEYPRLATEFGLKPAARLSLDFRMAAPARLILTGTGPKILRLAGEVADGVLCASNFPRHARAVLASPASKSLSNLDSLEDGLRGRSLPAFERAYGLNVSVSSDAEAARSHARRQAAIIVAQETAESLSLAGVDLDALAPFRDALKNGATPRDAATLVPQQTADALIVSGEPRHVIERLVDLIGVASRAGFGQFYLGSPLGPDALEAVRLLRDQVMPEMDGALGR